jgi:hypothetical protein
MTTLILIWLALQLPLGVIVGGLLASGDADDR